MSRPGWSSPWPSCRPSAGSTRRWWSPTRTDSAFRSGASKPSSAPSSSSWLRACSSCYPPESTVSPTAGSVPWQSPVRPGRVSSLDRRSRPASRSAGSICAMPERVSRLTYTLDCSDAENLSSFWAEVLDYSLYGPHGSYWTLVPPESVQEPWFVLQQVNEPKAGKNRMHVDIHVADLEGEAQRVEALGARRVSDEALVMGSFSWWVMADP